MQFRAKQIAPPKDWGMFEDLCHALFKRVWSDALAQKNGRRGQAQSGVDVFGSPNGNRQKFFGVQCKCKESSYDSKAIWRDVLTEIEKAERFSPRLEKWIFATTAPVDAALQMKARELSRERVSRGLFSVEVLGWDEIRSLMADFPDVIVEFYPEHADDLPRVIRALGRLPKLEERVSSLVTKLDADSQKAQPSVKSRNGTGSPLGSDRASWISVGCVVAVHALLIGGLAVFALWPSEFERLGLVKSLFIAIIVTLPFDAVGAGIIYLGAMDRRPLGPEVRYAIVFAACTVTVCQSAALWQMFINGMREPREMLLWGVVGAGLCCLPAWAKRHEHEEDERDRREGNHGEKSFFRGKRKGGPSE